MPYRSARVYCPRCEADDCGECLVRSGEWDNPDACNCLCLEDDPPAPVPDANDMLRIEFESRISAIMLAPYVLFAVWEAVYVA